MRHRRNFQWKLRQILCCGDGDGMKFGDLREVPEECALEKLLLRVVRRPDNHSDPMDGTEHNGRLDHILKDHFWR